VTIDGYVHSDGGVVMGINVFDAVSRCKASGYAEKDIVLDIVTCNNARLTNWNETNQDASEIKARAEAIQSYSMTMSDIFDACRAYPEVEWRYFVQAPPHLPGSSAVFKKSDMTAMTQIGLIDGANASIGIHCAQAEQFRHSKIVKDLRRKKTPLVV